MRPHYAVYFGSILGRKRTKTTEALLILTSESWLAFQGLVTMERGDMRAGGGRSWRD